MATNNLFLFFYPALYIMIIHNAHNQLVRLSMRLPTSSAQAKTTRLWCGSLFVSRMYRHLNNPSEENGCSRGAMIGFERISTSFWGGIL